MTALLLILGLSGQPASLRKPTKNTISALTSGQPSSTTALIRGKCAYFHVFLTLGLEHDLPPVMVVPRVRYPHIEQLCVPAFHRRPISTEPRPLLGQLVTKHSTFAAVFGGSNFFVNLRNCVVLAPHQRHGPQREQV